VTSHRSHNSKKEKKITPEPILASEMNQYILIFFFFALEDELKSDFMQEVTDQIIMQEKKMKLCKNSSI
jgi:hypothetical protein